MDLKEQVRGLNDQDKKELFEELLLTYRDSLTPGNRLTWFQFSEPDSRILKTFTNPGISGSITFQTSELTALCPLTRQPDFYTVLIRYVPVIKCIESKSAKLYFGSYRSYPGFVESLAKKILNDWVKECEPKYCFVSIKMVARGGITIQVDQEYQ